MTGQSNTHEINLYGEQAAVWSAMVTSKLNVIAVVPVGSGKSYLASLLLPIAANTPSMHLGRDICFVAPSNGMLDRIIWGPLKKVCMEQYGLVDEKDINNSRKSITFKNGIKINCLSAETGLKGMNAALIVCDEAAEFSEETLQELSNRIRPAVGDPTSTGRLILISTPEGSNAFKKMYDTALLHPESWIVFHYNYKQMKVHSKAWVEKQRYLLSPLKFEKDLMCSFGSVEDQFFYAWKKSMAVSETSDRGKSLYTFHDFNKKLMSAIVAQVVGEPFTATGKIEILKTYSIKDCGTEMLARTIREDYPKREIKSIMDMSGAALNRDTTSVFGVTDRTILEKYGFRIQNSKKSNPYISDTDNSSNSFITQGRLILPLSELKMLESLDTYHYEDGSRKQLVKYKEADLAHIDSLGDCLRYGIHHLFPMQHYQDESVLPAGPEYIDSDRSMYVAPGSEYINEHEREYDDFGNPTPKSLLKKVFFNDQVDDPTW
jgi:hypothetical protein